MFQSGMLALLDYRFWLRSEQHRVHMPDRSTNLRGDTEQMTTHTQSAPRQAVIREVGLRDGLKSIATILPTFAKREWIQAAYAAGQREIEVGSLVPAKQLPQLAETAELVDFAKSLPWLFVSVLL